eukprot:TRINITY_DN897_c0_g1_i1.p1 TRINITY_DN897_c0_g1~~TRINITY_DN897_c0_g1_i1.p1  ORF type:complete len:302 (+),score=52.96 TRINITY_DN897_c0_g1_i1:348-1253(+)
MHSHLPSISSVETSLKSCGSTLCADATLSPIDSILSHQQPRSRQTSSTSSPLLSSSSSAVSSPSSTPALENHLSPRHRSESIKESESLAQTHADNLLWASQTLLCLSSFRPPIGGDAIKPMSPTVSSPPKQEHPLIVPQLQSPSSPQLLIAPPKITTHFTHERPGLQSDLVPEQELDIQLTTLTAGSQPPTPTNGYLLFCSEWRRKLLQINPFSTSNDMNRVLGAKWKALPGADREKYRRLARDWNDKLSSAGVAGIHANRKRAHATTESQYPINVIPLAAVLGDPLSIRRKTVAYPDITQ